MKILSLYLCVVLTFGVIACSKDGADSGINPPDAPFVPDEDYVQDRNLLNKLQQDIFGYAWEYADDNSGMCRERYPDDPTITVGGSGFGIAALVVGVERGFITRNQAVERLMKVTDFLLNKAETFHGAYPHWLDGATGKAKPFSTLDNGADLVETSFLIQGLLIAREYFNGQGDEKAIRERINSIWERVEWSHFTNGNDYLLWHWSPDHGFQINQKIAGFNECMITYILALASPTYPITAKEYSGWIDANNYAPRSDYGFTIEAASSKGGPLFFTHYSFIGMNPHLMADHYVKKGYFVRNVSHAMVNRAYCLNDAPSVNKYTGDFWGLTASYVKDGYAASEPDNDRATVAPTAALASMPYIPAYSMPVLWNIYNNYRVQMWGKYGPADAMNLKDNWFATGRYLAIDQLPIVCMVENYRSGILWEVFMQAPEISKAFSLSGITVPQYETSGFHTCIASTELSGSQYISGALDLIRHPDSGKYRLSFYMVGAGGAEIVFTDEKGGLAKAFSVDAKQGINTLDFGLEDTLRKGKYKVVLKTAGSTAIPLILSLK